MYIDSTYQKEDPMFDMFGTNVSISYDKVENAVTIQQGKKKLYLITNLGVATLASYLNYLG